MSAKRIEDAPYTPSPWGTLYHNLPYDEVLGAGAAGPGKTTVLVAEPFPQIMVEHQRCSKPHPYPLEWGQSKGWALFLRRSLPMLKQTILRSHRVFPRIDQNAKWSSEENTWTFSSGYKYQFGHCKDPDSYLQYIGNEYTLIMYDELVQFEEEQYTQINTRLRTDDPVLAVMMKIRSMSNPLTEDEAADAFAVKDPFWVRRHFIDPAPTGKTVITLSFELPDGQKATRTRFYLPATINDNPNKSFVAQYVKNLASKPRHIREALLSGNWYFTRGSYYGEAWNDRIHTTVPFRVPPDWPIFRSMDWGYKHHGCVHWWAISEEGTLFCIRELTFIGKKVPEVAKMVKEIETSMDLFRGGKSIIVGVADPQLFEERGGSALTMAEEFARGGVHWLRADRRQRRISAERLLQRMRDHADETRESGIIFFRSCVNAIRTLPMILADKDHPEEPMDGGDDHWHDSVRYAVMYAARGRAGLQKARRAFDHTTETSEIGQDRGLDGYGSLV